MNRSTIENYLIKVEQIDFWEKAKEAFPDKDLSEVNIEGWKLDKMASTLKRIIDQFKERMQADDFDLLPANYFNQEIDSNVSLVPNYLDYLITQLTNKSFPEVLKSVKWLASYQAAYGFWNKAVTKVHDPDTIILQNKSQEIEALLSKIELGISEIDKLKNTIQKSYEELQAFYTQKQTELETITKARDDIQAKQNQVASILVEINNYKSQADAALSNTNTTRDESKRIAEEGKAFLEDFTKKADALKSALEELITGEEQRIKVIDEASTHIKSKRDYIDLKEKEIIRLASQASDGSLGYTFDKRQDTLGKSARWWMYGTWGMTIVLFVWMYLVFTYVSETRYEPQWINPLINTLKTIPAFVILAFIARQYTKERNLQEEYAFKASIAMTLTAYADEIAREEDADRRIIIRETIEKVHKAPFITSESISFFGIRPKQVNAIVEKATEAVTKVIDKIPTK